jgi:hypothetical protein
MILRPSRPVDTVTFTRPIPRGIQGIITESMSIIICIISTRMTITGGISICMSIIPPSTMGAMGAIPTMAGRRTFKP